MPIYIDQMNRKIILNKVPERIISLVPSQSELLWDLGLKESLAGITKFCIHPKEMFKSIARVGGTKKLNIKKIHELKPDLIIGNKEENTKEQIEELEKHFPVWMSDIKNLEDASRMIKEIGNLCGKKKDAEEISTRISESFVQLKVKPHPEIKKAIYLIWQDPLMCASPISFIGHLLNSCGFENAIQETDKAYPTLSITELTELKPQLILLSSEPYPFREKHVSFFKEKNSEAKVLLVDGEMFSWYGSRLLKTPKYLSELVKTINDSVS